MGLFLIFPHQLFEIKYIRNALKDNNIKKIYIWEHSQYFEKYNFNQKKIILHKSSMIYYFEYLVDNLKNYDIKIKYKSIDQFQKLNKKLDKMTYTLFDPIDKIKLPGDPNILESPNFILNKDLYKKYRNKTDNFIFGNFYRWSKNEIDLFPDLKSKDKENRKKLPKNIKIPNLPSNEKDEIYIKKGIEFTKKNYNNNYGNVNNFIFPVTHKTAKKWLSYFIEHKFELFGPYQDAIDSNNNYLFHSVLSSSINIGLLNPDYIIDQISKYKKKININSFEGYLRQLFWREYQRYCYIYGKFENKNYFGNNKKITNDWYTGNTKIIPVDTCIKKAFDSGYLNHIERLMVIGNYMNLSGIKPQDGFNWFMEFSCDSYEWVMVQNVMDMVFFVTGGLTMRRPYVSSSNYILKMSNYKKGEWSEIWDDKYRKFINDHKKELHKFRYYFRSI